MVSNGDPKETALNGRERDEKGRFVPGNGCGNGRPKGLKGLAATIRDATHNGEDLARWYLGIWQGEQYHIRWRIQAAEWLTERGFGKVVQAIAPTDPTGEHEYSGGLLTNEERINKLAAILDEARTRAGR